MDESGTEPEAGQPCAAASPQADPVQPTLKVIAQALLVGLGLVAIIVDCDVSTLNRWGQRFRRPARSHGCTLRGTYQVFEVVAGADSLEVAHAWQTATPIS